MFEVLGVIGDLFATIAAFLNGSDIVKGKDQNK